jgi:hypothetical protein
MMIEHIAEPVAVVRFDDRDPARSDLKKSASLESFHLDLSVRCGT